MRKLAFTALAAVSAACGGGPRLPDSPKGEAVLELRGAIEGAPITIGAGDLAGLPRATVRGRDPVTGREAAWEGASLAALVQRVRPAKRAVIDTVVFRTRDGAAVPVPLTLVRQLKPALVRAEGEPALVAWPNLEQVGLEADARAPAWWARDVVALEFVPWPRAFGAALAPPLGASAAARVGGGVFASRCVACHVLRGAGGTVGPALTLAGGTLDLARFEEAVAAHGFASRGLSPPDATQRAQLWAYLQAIARAPTPEPDPRGERKDEAAGWEDAETPGRPEPRPYPE